MKIIDIESLQILDSRGNPTIQVKIILEDGSSGEFRVPSGASTGIHEAHELRDNNEKYYHGKSVLKVIDNISNIKSKLLDIDFTQEELDNKLIELDATKNKTKLGANTILGISIAFAKASAKYYNLSTYDYLFRLTNNLSFTNKKEQKFIQPHLFANVINGGLHSGNNLNIQEFMIIPTTGSLQEKVRMISEIYQSLKEIIAKDFSKSETAVGDEGGFAPNISKASQALDLLTKAVKKCNYTSQISFAMDTAASDFYNSKTKKYEVEKGKKLDYKELTKYYNKLCEKYPIIVIEDPFEEDDFKAWKYYKKNVIEFKSSNPLTGKKELLIIGDDLLVTNPSRIQIAKDKDLCNSLLLKINQIGSLTESIKAFKMASENGWHTIVSHRSGETTDDFIADLSVALESSIKIGAPARGERVAKYNRLLNIFK